MKYKNKDFYNNLKSLGVIPEVDLISVMKESENQQRPLHKMILERELLSDKNMGIALSNFLGYPFVELKKEVIDKELLKAIPEVVARKQLVIAFKKEGNNLKLAMVDPTDDELATLIEKKTGDKVIKYLATEKNVEDVLSIYGKDLSQSFEDLIKDVSKKGGGEKDIPTEKVVEILINYAYENKASDIHLEPGEKKSVVRFRIDGVLHDVLDLQKDLHEQVVSRIKVLSKLRTDEHLSAQDGKMVMPMEHEDLDIRVSVVPIVEGEKVVMRLLSERSREFSLQELGISENVLGKIRAAYERPHGMVLSTGPTGSGKTTTIYAILKIINTRDVNIATIEDPVEYDVEGINQIQVNQKTNLTFAHGLRAILRQDPNIIFVGEIRDAETAGIAVNSSMTGHLVLSTLHTNDAATTLPRFIEMGVEPFLVATTVNIIIAQRLVRTICEKCKVSTTLVTEQAKQHAPAHLVEKYFGTDAETRVYEGKGCDVCHNSGFDGRIGVFEVLEITDSIRKLITQKANGDEIKSKAVEEGMITMLEDGLDKVTKGLTTLDEVLRVTRD